MSFLSKMLQPALKWYVKGAAQKNLPNYNERLSVDGLTKSVEIIRDKWAVPHVYAENQNDLFFAQGYLHAQDRLWQMELTRRVVSGRLSEVVGRDALDTDRLTRALGFKKLGEQDVERFADHELTPILASYVLGINTYLENCKYPPAEFKLLKIKIEKWTAADCFGMARLVAMQMSSGWIHELERMGLAEKFGIEKVQEIFPKYPAQNPIALRYGNETNRIVDGKLEAFKGPYLNALGGSNNWVVAADKMETAAAALCNDPHLLIGTPNIWYENHLIAPDYKNTGVSIPGVPFVLIGHNRNIAWGATLSYADIQDTYIEKFTSSRCLQYRFGDRILKAKHSREEIYIKGENVPHVENVISTHHGPIILDIDEVNKIALASNALRDNEMILAFYELNMAKGWNDFVGACEKLVLPSLNLVYADTDNNIGYYMTGEVPVRTKQKGLLPNNGFNANHEWTGTVPFEELPHVFNPEQGYFYTCNHKVVDDEYPHDLGNIWMNGYRARQLDMLLNSKDKFSFSDFEEWQMDFYCAPAMEFAEIVKTFMAHTEYNDLSEGVKGMVELLIHWTGNLTADCLGGTVYQVTKQELINIIFEKSIAIKGGLTNPNLSIFGTTEFFSYDTVTILKLFKNPTSIWWKKSPEKTLATALTNAEAYLRKTLGEDRKAWKWGALHQLCAKHALGKKPILGKIFNVGNVPIGGDPDTLCQVSFSPGEKYGGSMIAASYRQMIDMGNLENSKCSAPIGQSGNLVSPHYKDQLEMWMRGEYKPMIWTKEQVEMYKKYTAILKPS